MTAVQYFDEQMQERVIAQDVVARKMIIEISMEDYMDIKRQSNKMFKQQIIDASERLKWVDYSLVQNGEQYYTKTYGSKGSDEHIEDNLEEIPTSSQTEISDEEIVKAFTIETPRQVTIYHGEIEGAKWYREQLKKKQ